jgi:hypothetical protein
MRFSNTVGLSTTHQTSEKRESASASEGERQRELGQQLRERMRPIRHARARAWRESVDARAQAAMLLSRRTLSSMSMQERARLALRPFGSSIVSLSEFCSTVTGSFGVGIVVSQRRKSSLNPALERVAQLLGLAVDIWQPRLCEVAVFVAEPRSSSLPCRALCKFAVFGGVLGSPLTVSVRVGR